MFNPDIVFTFYSKSADKYPGKGSGEMPGDLSLSPEYDDLSKIKDWRKMLSNFWISPFELDGRRWNSVEHYYQGSKFKENNPEFYHLFSLDSGSQLSLDPVMAKSAGGKTGKVCGKQFRPKSIQMDTNFFTTNRSTIEMNAAQNEKFTTIPEMRDVLLKTREAKLMHTVGRSSEKIYFANLVDIRNKLRSLCY
jgi:predicted NAD-dependent protein-ADP-ribosyltransferase YbiA (DUF1768 family)